MRIRLYQLLRRFGQLRPVLLPLAVAMAALGAALIWPSLGAALAVAAAVVAVVPPAKRKRRKAEGGTRDSK